MSDTALNYHFESASDDSVNFEALLRKLDREFADLPPSLVERFNFTFDGLNFDVRRVAQEDGHRFLVNASLGYLPFSVESAERREAIKTIIMSSRRLPIVRFAVDTSSKISAGALFDMQHIVAPDFIFYPLMLFMQEARPFIRLIGKYLHAPTVVPPAPPPKAEPDVVPQAEPTA